jgi:hypothetical protein
MRAAFGAVGRIIAEGAWPAHPARIEWATAHSILRAEGPMNTPKPDQTIDQLFEGFLADQEARLSPKTFDKYERIIHLYRSYLESYWPGHSGKDSEAITQAKGTYCGTFGADDITSGFSEFLGYFMPRKVIAGNETMKAAGTVVKKLARWLTEKGYTEDDESVRELVGTTARDLPASQKLLDDLYDWLSETGPIKAGKEIEGHFLIRRTGPGQIWLESMISGDAEMGPIPVPADVARSCKAGWDVGGVVGLTNQGWRLVEVWNISP